MLANRRLPCILLLLTLPRGAAAQPLRYTIDTPSEARSTCVLRALEDGVLHVEQADTRLTLNRYVELRREGAVLPKLLTRNFISLANGDRLPLDPDASATLEENRLLVWPAPSLPGLHDKGLSLYLPHAVLLFWSMPEGVDDAERFIANLQEESRKRDVVHLKNGDRVEGSVTALGGKIGCTIATANRKVQLPWSKLAGIAWNTERQARLRTKRTYTRAVLADGARLNFLDLRLDEKTRRWVGKTQFGPSLELPEAHMLALDVRQGQAVDLAELTPLRYVHTPYLGTAWPLVKDAAVTGQPLRLAGSTYEKGLGMHAACQAAYKLDGQYQRFEALVGFDETISRRGRARLAIHLDEKRVELNDGKELTSRDPPLRIRLDVRKVREMTLVVDFGSFGDVQAHVNWAKARLIKND